MQTYPQWKASRELMQVVGGILLGIVLAPILFVAGKEIYERFVAPPPPPQPKQPQA